MQRPSQPTMREERADGWRRTGGQEAPRLPVAQGQWGGGCRMCAQLPLQWDKTALPATQFPRQPL